MKPITSKQAWKKLMGLGAKGMLRPRAWLPVIVAALLIVSSLTSCSSAVQSTPTVSAPTPTSASALPTPLALLNPPSLNPTIGPTIGLAPQATATTEPKQPTIAPTVAPTTPPTATAAPTQAPTKTAPAATPTNAPTSSLEQVFKGFSVANAYGHVSKLAAEIGSRPTGSAAGGPTREYIAATLQSYGYTVSQPPISFAHFTDQGASLTVETPAQRVFTATAIAYSSKSEASGEIVPVGLGRSSDYAGKNLAGKIALVKRGELTFTQKTAAAKAAGVAGLVIYNNAAGSFFGLVSDQPAFPVVTLSGEDGNQLAGLASQGKVSIKLNAKTNADQGKDANVITRIPTDGPWILIGAHFDSVPTGPGANDNASGTGLMLEMARLIAQTPYKDKVAFAAFMGEENGFLGSNNYVAALSQNRRDALEAMINLDMVGEGATLYVRTNSSGPLASNVIAKANQAGIKTAPQGLSADSDFAPFSSAGMRVFDVCTDLDPYYHTNGDTIDKISQTTLANAARVVWLLFEGLATNLN